MAASVSAVDASTLELTLSTLKQFAADRLPQQLLLDLDHRDECPVDIVREMCGATLGIPMLFVPEEYGGLGGDAFDVYRVCEQMAAIDLGVATAVLATLLGSDPIRVGGTEEQKQRWLGGIANDGLLFAYAATEPEAGSDLGSLRTRAERVYEGEQIVGYKITGSKQWISNGGIADAYSVLANAPGGPSWFIVEQGAEGLTHDKPEDKHGIRLSNTAALSFTDVYVPAERLIGLVEGKGLTQAQAVFGFTRLMVAAFALGAGRASLDIAIPYAAERIQAGTPLSEKQGYTHKLIVPHVVRLEAARAYVEDTAARLDQQEGALITEGAIAKYLASEFANTACDCAMQALGGYGYTHEYHLEKIKRDVRITTIYEGTSEIMEITISRDRWQAHLKTSGQYFHTVAAELEQLEARQPHTGAATVALAAHTLANLMERARAARLTRHQHVLMRLGELIAYVECAAAMCRKVVLVREQRVNEKADRRYDAAALAAMSRVFARETARKIATDGIGWIVSASASATEVSQFVQSLNTAALHHAQAGMIADMDAVADVLWERAANRAAGA